MTSDAPPSAVVIEKREDLFAGTNFRVFLQYQP